MVKESEQMKTVAEDPDEQSGSSKSGQKGKPKNGKVSAMSANTPAGTNMSATDGKASAMSGTPQNKSAKKSEVITESDKTEKASVSAERSKT